MSKAGIYIEKAADTVSSAAGVVSSAGIVMGAAIEAGAPIIVPFAKFMPLISEIGNLFNEIVEITQAAEHNKRTCEALKLRVYAAELAVIELRVKRGGQDNQDFFNNKNYLCLQSLVNIITQIKKFTAEISQMKTLIKYIQAKNIERTFKELCKEFDSCINVLNFSLSVKTNDEITQLKEDQKELYEYLQGMKDGIKTDVSEVRDSIKDVEKDSKEIKASITNLSKELSSTVLKVNVMNTTMEKFISENSQKKIDNIFQVHQLKLSDYEKDSDELPRKNGRVTKWFNVRNKGEEFAFKIVEDEKMVQNQVTILRELHDWQNIIKFYGLTTDGNKWYLVTEWAECGNLREFYTIHKDRFDLTLKLRVSLDISRGLNFLRTVEIVHRDIRAENILITLNETAKLANFKLSRHIAAATLNQSQNLERVRYCAPELLERAPNYKYDQKCEVYSFGILLWEIAEERIPYQDNDDIMDITDKVRNKMYREDFSEPSPMPEEFKRLEREAVHHDPDFRPKITKMFEVLRDCVKNSLNKRISSNPPDSLSSISSQTRKYSTPKHTPKRAYSIDQDTYAIPTNLPDFESFKYMTLTEAAKQHKMIDRQGKLVGDIDTAYKCFEAYSNLSKTNTANRNQIKAKYYKAYYIARGLVGYPQNDKDRVVAELFKEVADDDANEFPEAKVRYGDCLYNGKGVEQDFAEALKYFEKAAEDGFKVAMYNAGNIYYNGIGGKKNREKAIHYMKLAAYNDYEPAVKFCKEHNL